MLRRRNPPLHPAAAIAATIAAIALLAFSTPAQAGDADYKGWYGNLDLALAQPNSLDQNYANHTDFSGSRLRTERLVMDNDSALTWRLGVGYSWGTKGRLQVSYWTFDNDDENSGTEFGELNPLVIGYSAYYGQYLYDNVTGVDFEATSDLQASTLDVDYIRPIPVGDKFTVNWLAGLRATNYEEEQTFFGEETTYGAAYSQVKKIESDAIGLKVGATAVFDFTKRFSMEASAIFSFLQADVDGTGSVTTDDGSTVAEEIEASDENVRGEIRDFGLRAVWDVGPVDLYVGYEASNWDGLVTDALAGGGLVPSNANQRGRDSISFNSWNVGARWRFQDRK